MLHKKPFLFKPTNIWHPETLDIFLDGSFFSAAKGLRKAVLVFLDLVPMHISNITSQVTLMDVLGHTVDGRNLAPPGMYN